jgi:glutamate synthase domain-containing protein 3
MKREIYITMLNKELVGFYEVSSREDIEELKNLIEEHVMYTVLKEEKQFLALYKIRF